MFTSPGAVSVLVAAATSLTLANANQYAMGQFDDCQDNNGVCTNGEWIRVETLAELNSRAGELAGSTATYGLFLVNGLWIGSGSGNCGVMLGDGTCVARDMLSGGFSGDWSSALFSPMVPALYANPADVKCDSVSANDDGLTFENTADGSGGSSNPVLTFAQQQDPPAGSMAFAYLSVRSANPYVAANRDTDKCLGNRNPGIFWRTTQAPTGAPTTEAPTSESPTVSPTNSPTQAPTEAPSESPSESPTVSPTKTPTAAPTGMPTAAPTSSPTKSPTEAPTESPSESPTVSPTDSPTQAPTEAPSESPTVSPTKTPTAAPTSLPTVGSCDGFELIDAVSSNCTALMSDGEMCSRKCSDGESVLGYYTCRAQSMRGQSICARTEVADQLEVTTEKILAGQMSIVIDGVDEETLSVLVQETVSIETSAMQPLSTSSKTQMLTLTPQNGSNAIEPNATLAGGARRLLNNSEVGCVNPTTNDTTVIHFSIRLPVSVEVISSARLLELVEAWIANDTQKPVCVAWQQEPIVTEELMIKTKSGKMIQDNERFDIDETSTTSTNPGDKDDDDGKGSAASEIAIAVAIAAITLLCCLCSVLAITILRRRQQHQQQQERDTTPEFAVTLSKCENGYSNKQPEMDANEAEASTLGNTGADIDDLTSLHVDDSERGETWL